MLLFGQPSPQTGNADHDRAIHEAQIRAFLRFVPLSSVATQLSAMGLAWLFSGLMGPAKTLAWLTLATILCVSRFVLALLDSRPGMRPGPTIVKHAVLVGLSAALFGLALVSLFPRTSGYQQLIVSIFFMAFISSGVFSGAMVRSIALTWVAILSAAVYLTLALAHEPLLLASLVGYTLFVVYIALMAQSYYRLYLDRFAYQARAEDREREFATLFEQSPLSIILTDLGGRVLQANAMMESMSGYSKAELLGKNPRILKSGKTSAESYAELWAAITAGRVWTGEFINRNKEGRDYIEKASISPIKDSSGAIMSYMAIKEDITRQRDYEAQLRRQTEIIEILLRDYEDQSSDWLWELDAGLRVTHVSDRFRLLFKDFLVQGRLARESLQEWLPPGDVEAARLAAGLSAAFSEARPFKGLEIKVLVGEAIHWLSFSGVPRHGPDEGLEGWRGVCRDVSDRKKLQAELSRRANFDEPSGLPNRYRFKELLEAELLEAGEEHRAILGIMELGNLGLIRADLGSSTCDSIIAAFIEEFRAVVGRDILLARLERDEFAFWAAAPDVYKLESVHRFARKLKDPLEVNGDFFSIDLNIGLAFYPEDAPDRGGLLHAADLALNGVKSYADRKVMRYREDLATDFMRRLTLVKEFPAALAAGQFRMLYQPQVDSGKGELRGAEALIRWEHPAHGSISPAEFIPLAEESGFIKAMGAWSLLQVCRDAMLWERPLKVSANVSGVQLRDSRGLVQAVRVALEESALPPERLVLEITESAMLGDQDEVVGALADLRGMGISIALDDFGTGYSSLSYIQRLRLDKLKIDQSFVRRLGLDRDAEKIIGIILEFSRSMGLETVAEGIEEESQAAFLRASGCDWFQGYLFGKPMSQGAFRELILMEISAREGRL